MPSEQQEAATNAEDLGRLLSRAADLAEITGELAPTLRRAADAARIQASTAARLAAPSPPVDREALIGIIEGTDYGAGGWVSRTSTEHAATIADALISAGVVAQPPADDEVIDRVAAAIWGRFISNPHWDAIIEPEVRELWRDMARCALAAIAPRDSNREAGQP